jgi:hypothetical protein
VLDDGETRRRGQAGKLEREDELGIARQRNQSIDTLQVSGRGTASTGRQSPSGGGSNDASKTGGAKPEGAKRKRGRGYLPGLNTPRVLRVSTRIKTSRSTCSLLASTGNRRQAGGTNGAEGRATDEVVQLGRGRKPLKRETWTWQQDEISLQGNARSKPSRARETLRTEQRWAWDAHRTWTRRADVAKRCGTPRKAPVIAGRAQVRHGCSGRRRHDELRRRAKLTRG